MIIRNRKVVIVLLVIYLLVVYNLFEMITQEVINSFSENNYIVESSDVEY